MSDSSAGWQSLRKPARTLAGSGPEITPGFRRLARLVALSAAGDAMIAVALAGSLFFSIDPSAARWRVGLYLAFTVAPFAVVGPLIGPALDRSKGGRRMMMILVNSARALVALLMVSNVDTLLLFPLAFAGLVGGKSFAIGRAALVPTVVRDEAELVTVNSRMSLVSGLSGFVGAAIGGAVSLIFGSPGAVAMAAVAFVGAAIASTTLPHVAVAAEEPGNVEKQELRSVGIRLASTAMAVLRGIVGYLTFLIAFAFRGGADGVDLSGVGTAFGSAARSQLGFSVGGEGGAPAWQLGAVLAFNVLGMLAGALLAPRLRKSTPEENILLGALVLICGMGLFGAWSGDLTAAALVSFSVGLGASSGKLAFDSIVQRDAPDANYGRSFARFETRFQVFWVIGALLSVVVKTPAGLGFFVIAIAAGAATVIYSLGSRSGVQPRERPPVMGIPDPLEGMDTTLTDDDLKASYPEMNLRSPVRTPTGWTDADSLDETRVDGDSHRDDPTIIDTDLQ